MSESTASNGDSTLLVSLFSPELKAERKHFLRQYVELLVLATFFMWIMLSVYWGSVHNEVENLPRLKVLVIDLDTPAALVRNQVGVVGSSFIDTVNKINSGLTAEGEGHLGWTISDPSLNVQFDLSSGTGGLPRGRDVQEYAANVVLDQKYFAAIVVNPSATLNALNAFNSLLNGSISSYTGNGSYSSYYTEGRNFGTYDQWIMPGLTRIVSTASKEASTLFTKQISTQLAALTPPQYSNLNKTELSRILASPFAATSFSLRPLYQFAAIPATTIGLLYLLIFTYFLSAAWFGARMPIVNKIKLHHFILLRILVPIAGWFLISLSISLMSLAFGVSFDVYYGKGGFVLFWLINWLTEIALGFTMDVAISILGIKYAAFFLIFFVILNVSVVFLDLADQNHFYSYGFITPVWNAVDASKSICLGTKNHLIQNFAVNFAWAFFGIGALIWNTILQRRSWIREQAGKSE